MWAADAHTALAELQHATARLAAWSRMITIQSDRLTVSGLPHATDALPAFHTPPSTLLAPGAPRAVGGKAVTAGHNTPLL